MHVEAKPLSAHPWYLRPFFRKQKRTYGAVLEPALLWARKQHVADDAVIELTGLIAFQKMSSKFNSALDVPPQGFCKHPTG